MHILGSIRGALAVTAEGTTTLGWDNTLDTGNVAAAAAAAVSASAAPKVGFAGDFGSREGGGNHLPAVSVSSEATMQLNPHAVGKAGRVQLVATNSNEQHQQRFNQASQQQPLFPLAPNGYVADDFDGNGATSAGVMAQSPRRALQSDETRL